MAGNEGKLPPALLELLSNSLDAALANASEVQAYPPEVVLEVVNEAMAQAGLQIPLPIPIEVVQLRRTLGKESDRGCALSATAYLETELGHLIEAALVEDANVTKEILTGTGPLATFSSRFDVAYLLGLIGRRARRDLHLIRK